MLLLGILPSPSPSPCPRPSPSPSPIEFRTPLQAGSEGGKSTFVQHFKNVWNIRASNSEARILKWVLRINTISPMFRGRSHQNVYKDNCQRCSSHSAAHIKHRKNCECCPHHSLFKGHNVNVNIVVLNCQKCNQCLKCQVSGHKSLESLVEGVL